MAKNEVSRVSAPAKLVRLPPMSEEVRQQFKLARLENESRRMPVPEMWGLSEEEYQRIMAANRPPEIGTSSGPSPFDPEARLNQAGGLALLSGTLAMNPVAAVVAGAAPWAKLARDAERAARETRGDVLDRLTAMGENVLDNPETPLAIAGPLVHGLAQAVTRRTPTPVVPEVIPPMRALPAASTVQALPATPPMRALPAAPTVQASPAAPTVQALSYAPTRDLSGAGDISLPSVYSAMVSAPVLKTSVSGSKVRGQRGNKVSKGTPARLQGEDDTSFVRRLDHRERISSEDDLPKRGSSEGTLDDLFFEDDLPENRSDAPSNRGHARRRFQRIVKLADIRNPNKVALTDADFEALITSGEASVALQRAVVRRKDFPARLYDTVMKSGRATLVEELATKPDLRPDQAAAILNSEYVVARRALAARSDLTETAVQRLYLDKSTRYSAAMSPSAPSYIAELAAWDDDPYVQYAAAQNPALSASSASALLARTVNPYAALVLARRHDIEPSVLAGTLDVVTYRRGNSIVLPESVTDASQEAAFVARQKGLAGPLLTHSGYSSALNKRARDSESIYDSLRRALITNPATPQAAIDDYVTKAFLPTPEPGSFDPGPTYMNSRDFGAAIRRRGSDKLKMLGQYIDRFGSFSLGGFIQDNAGFGGRVGADRMGLLHALEDKLSGEFDPSLQGVAQYIESVMGKQIDLLRERRNIMEKMQAELNSPSNQAILQQSQPARLPSQRIYERRADNITAEIGMDAPANPSPSLQDIGQSLFNLTRGTRWLGPPTESNWIASPGAVLHFAAQEPGAPSMLKLISQIQQSAQNKLPDRFDARIRPLLDQKIFSAGQIADFYKSLSEQKTIQDSLLSNPLIVATGSEWMLGDSPRSDSYIPAEQIFSTPLGSALQDMLMTPESVIAMIRNSLATAYTPNGSYVAQMFHHPVFQIIGKHPGLNNPALLESAIKGVQADTETLRGEIIEALRRRNDLGDRRASIINTIAQFDLDPRVIAVRDHGVRDGRKSNLASMLSPYKQDERSFSVQNALGNAVFAGFAFGPESLRVLASAKDILETPGESLPRGFTMDGYTSASAAGGRHEPFSFSRSSFGGNTLRAIIADYGDPQVRLPRLKLSQAANNYLRLRALSEVVTGATPQGRRTWQDWMTEDNLFKAIHDFLGKSTGIPHTEAVAGYKVKINPKAVILPASHPEWGPIIEEVAPSVKILWSRGNLDRQLKTQQWMQQGNREDSKGGNTRTFFDPSKDRLRVPEGREKEYEEYMDSLANLDTSTHKNYLVPKDWRTNKEYDRDYDYVAAFLADKAQPVKADDGHWHMSDVGKMPNHPTFSNESYYARDPKWAPYAGRWEGEKFIPPEVRQDSKGGDTPGSPLGTPIPTGPAPASTGPRIVINPQVFKDKRDALCVAFNEAFRLVMEENAFEPVSEPTEKQRKFFADTAYSGDELQLRRTILARIATLDTSVSDPTDEQLEETAEMLEMVMEVGAPQNEWEQSAVQRLHDVIVKARETSAARSSPLPPKQ